MRVVITTNHLKFSSLYLQNAASVRTFNVVRQEKIVIGFSGNVYTGTINRLDLSDGSVQERHLAKGAVTTPILADESVTEAKIRDSNVTLQKLEPSIRNVFREIKPHTNVIVATKDANEDYHVSRRIYAHDFMVENADGALSPIQSVIIDDTKTSGSTTWSSVYITGKLNEKSNTSHTHETYSLVWHNHDDLYSPKSHNHDGVYSPSWHDHDTRYYTKYQTDTKISTLKDEVVVASKDANLDYHVERKIYAKDFVVENADGSLSDIQSTIIDDTQTSSRTTWSSVLIHSWLSQKSDAGHTHEGYALASHTHTKDQIPDFPNVSDWAQRPSKPAYTASEVGAIPSSGQYQINLDSISHKSAGELGYPSAEWLKHVWNADYGDQTHLSVIGNNTNKPYLNLTDKGMYWNNGTNREVYHSGNFDPSSKININPANLISNKTFANNVWFDYNWASSSRSGSVINFAGLGGKHDVELFGQYNTSNFGLRTRNGDNGRWDPVSWLWHSNNLNSYTVLRVSDVIATNDKF